MKFRKDFTPTPPISNEPTSKSNQNPQLRKEKTYNQVNQPTWMYENWNLKKIRIWRREKKDYTKQEVIRDCVAGESNNGLRVWPAVGGKEAVDKDVVTGI